MVPSEPVVSKKSGHVFERKLIEKYIAAEGKCPVTGEALTVEDLLPIVTHKLTAPRTAKATSIPSLLAIFQSEWDTVMLETYNLKQHLETVRQELSQALYQHDAASRVIARLLQERDAARQALSELRSAGPHSHNVDGNGEGMEIEKGAEEKGITKSMLDKIVATSKQLSGTRKKRDLPEGHPSDDEVKSFTLVSHHEIHSASSKGITSVAVHNDGNRILTGGVDKVAKIFDRKAGKVTATLKGHSKKVNKVLFNYHSDSILTASADNTVKVWSTDGEGEDSYRATTIPASGHSDLHDFDLHPTGDFIATANGDSTWGFIDLGTGTTLASVAATEERISLDSIAFHLDGLLLATGSADGNIHVWDIKNQTKVHTFTSGSSGSIKTLSFSENGYHMASGSASSTVKLWDLRKLSDIATVDAGSAVNSVSFDYGGKYLSVGSSDVRVYKAKELSLLSTFSEATASVLSVKFSHNASYLAAASMDKSLRVYSTEL